MGIMKKLGGAWFGSGMPEPSNDGTFTISWEKAEEAGLVLPRPKTDPNSQPTAYPTYRAAYELQAAARRTFFSDLDERLRTHWRVLLREGDTETVRALLQRQIDRRREQLAEDRPRVDREAQQLRDQARAMLDTQHAGEEAARALARLVAQGDAGALACVLNGEVE